MITLINSRKKSQEYNRGNLSSYISKSNTCKSVSVSARNKVNKLIPKVSEA